MSELYNRYSEEDINFSGEELRRKAFIGEGLGCYANFEINSDYVEVLDLKIKSIYLHYFFDLYYLSFNLSDVELYLKDIKVYINSISNTVMVYYWDGDGSLLFMTPHYTILNSDCKKINDWRIV